MQRDGNDAAHRLGELILGSGTVGEAMQAHIESALSLLMGTNLSQNASRWRRRYHSRMQASLMQAR